MNGNAATAGALATVQMFVAGDWGVGPWWWLSPWAVGANALTPAGSLLKYADLVAGVSLGGPVQVEGGVWLPSSATASAATSNAIARSATSGIVPCPAGSPVSAGLFVSQGQRLRLTFFNTSNVSVGSITSDVAGAGTALRRVTVSGSAPSNTATVRVDVVGIGQVAGASLTFTRKPSPWTLGDGCDQVIVESETRDIDVIVEQPWANQSYTIKEVG